MGGNLLVTYEEQEGISKRVIDTLTANRSAIRTWQGKAIISSKIIEKGESVVAEELQYEVDFAFDIVNGHRAWDTRFLVGGHHNARESSFVRDDTHYYLTTGHTQESGRMPRQLHIFATPQPLVVHFDPLEKSIPRSQMAINFRFSMTILEPRMANRRENGISEEENEKFLQHVLANGFTDYRFKVDGDLFTRKFTNRNSGHLSEVFVVNFAQGGNITTYKQFTRDLRKMPPESVLSQSWDATYQKVNNVWIPHKTRTSRRSGDGSLKVEEIEWVNQRINQRIPEERFSLRGIGAFHGMNVVDHRIGGRGFRATGDEFPPEFEFPIRSFSLFQWIVMGVGVLMIIFGGGSLVYKKLRELKANG